MHKSILILKLDTPCTLTYSAMRVPQAEPVNFAKACIDACEAVGDVCSVCMLGHAAQEEAYGSMGTIKVLPYFGEPDSIKNHVNEDTEVILWQGMHAMSVPQPTSPAERGGKPQLMDPYAADCFQRLSLVKVWQIMMYNLASSKVLSVCKNMYFLLTDARLPLIELNKVAKWAVPNPLPKHIKLLTQACCANEFMDWHNKWGNGQWYYECNIADYVYQFEQAAYLPLHALPIWSHSKYHKNIADKTVDRAIFQAQSIKYMDDYRLSCLKKAIKQVKGKCTLHGRFLAEERAIAQYALGNCGNDLVEHLIDNSQSAESFFDSAQTLAEHLASLIITDARYQRFGLCPNRLVEALAVGTAPVCDKSVVQNCDTLLRDIVDEANKYVTVDAAGIHVDTQYSFVAQQSVDKLQQALLNKLGKFVDNDLFSKH